MKIGIITLNGFGNYGNRLQAYAMQQAIKKLMPDICVETIAYNVKYILSKNIIDGKFIRKYIFNRHGFRDAVKQNKPFYDIIKQYNMKRFTDIHIYTKYIFGINQKINSEYDYFVIGSDQIWNPYVEEGHIKIYKYLDKQKCIAYAASIGINEIPEDKKKDFKNMLDNTNKISVRENAGAELVEKYKNIKPIVVVDPTMLLTVNEWEKISEKPSWILSDKFIFVYYINDMPSEVKKELSRLAKENNLKIVDIMNKDNMDVYVTTPQEFLWLIKNAQMVYTDSFHGTVFSILFKKPFVVCPRENAGMDMNSRIDTLLSLFKFQNRLCGKEKQYSMNNPFDIDYSNVDNILLKERNKANKFLIESLKINGVNQI